MNVEAELQDAAEAGSLIVGAEETLKAMGDIDTVVLASNIPSEMEEAVREAAEEAGTAVEKVSQDNHQLGSLCMKPFAASVVGIR